MKGSDNLGYTFSKEWHLLAQESHLIQALLANGLTDLRRANLDRKGLFYAGFYNISIGLERLMKITLIIGHMNANNLSTPSRNTLRGYGHDLKKLFAECQKLSVANKILCDLAFSGVKCSIVDFLDRYSGALRYFNLDTLSGARPSIDPLEEWNQILRKTFSVDVPARRASRRIAESVAMATLLEGSATVLFHDLEQNPLSIFGYAVEPLMIELAAPYVCWHIIEVVHEINKVQFGVTSAVDAQSREMGLDMPVVPDVHEFYYFLEGGRARHLRKTRWP